MSAPISQASCCDTPNIEARVSKASALCQKRGARLTPLREAVLRLIYQSDKPIGAYTILDNLHPNQTRRPAPPTVYRALEFLLEQGLIHRLVSLNAYIACEAPEHVHTAQFLICEKCGCVQEIKNLTLLEDIERQADYLGFKVHDHIIELKGYCKSCQNS